MCKNFDWYVKSVRHIITTLVKTRFEKTHVFLSTSARNIKGRTCNNMTVLRIVGITGKYIHTIVRRELEFLLRITKNEAFEYSNLMGYSESFEMEKKN